MGDFQVDGDVIAEVVAYLNGHKTAPAQRMADAVLRLPNRHYQDAAALEAAREDATEAKQNGYELGLLAGAQEAERLRGVIAHYERKLDAAIDHARGKAGQEVGE